MSEIIYTGKETLQPLATKIKTLGGVEDSITLAEMEDSVKAANEGLAAQATTISEIAALLEGKSVPGGSGSPGGGSVETCSIRLICKTPDVYGYSYLAYRDGQFVPVFVSYYQNGGYSKIDVTLPDVICGGYIYVTVHILDAFLDTSINGEATTQKEHMTNSVDPVLLVHAPSTAGSTSTVTIIDND